MTCWKSLWTNNQAGTVMKCAIAGCNNAPTPLGMNESWPFDIATDGTDVDWINNGDGKVRKVGVNGPPNQVMTIADLGVAEERGLAIDAGYVYFTHRPMNVTGVVNRVSKAGGKTNQLQISMNPWGIALDATDIFWANSGMGMNTDTIKKTSITGVRLIVTRARNQNFPLSLAVDATTI